MKQEKTARKGKGSSSESLPAAPAHSPYIISPKADLSLIVGAVLLCPAILLPLSELTSAYTVWLLVMTFGAVGHHLPSFLRTYGDPQLFRHFRIRLIIAPFLVFAVTLAFSLKGLHGMLLVSMCWSIWHGMMQHFGFLRIYDAKVRSLSPVTARLDWWISAVWFGLCLVHSPTQGGSLLDALYNSGIPIVPLAYIEHVRTFFVVAAVLVTALYIWHALRGNQPRSWMKLGLLVGTFAYVWVVRVITPDPFLSVALFELLHDMQYLAIVWAFNRRLVQKGDRGVLPRFFYRPGIASVFGYVGACLAYGGVALFINTRVDAGMFKTVMEAFLITSGLLHFYYDSFIWKMRQTDTQQGLDIEARKYKGPSWEGLGQPVLAIVMIILLARLELQGALPTGLEKARAIAQAVPENPASLNNLGSELLEAGETEEAFRYLRKALALDPDLEQARITLSDGLAVLAMQSLEQEQVDDALKHYAEALSLEPFSSPRHADYASLLARAGRLEEARKGWERAVELDPGNTLARDNLIRLEQINRNRGQNPALRHEWLAPAP